MPAQAGRPALRDPGGFHHQRSRSRHRVPERCGPVVAEQEQQRRGQRFAQRRIRSTRAIAPQVQRPTREVEVDGRVGLAEVDQHGHVRRARIDVGTRARLVAHDVADGVLHLEGREPGMPERRRATRRRDGERPSGGEMFLPGDRPRPGVQRVGVGCRKGRQGEKDLHRRAQVQACPHAVLDGSGEADRPTASRHAPHAQSAQLADERVLGTERAGRDEGLSLCDPMRVHGPFRHPWRGWCPKGAWPSRLPANGRRVHLPAAVLRNEGARSTFCEQPPCSRPSSDRWAGGQHGRPPAAGACPPPRGDVVRPARRVGRNPAALRRGGSRASTGWRRIIEERGLYHCRYVSSAVRADRQSRESRGGTRACQCPAAHARGIRRRGSRCERR